MPSSPLPEQVDAGGVPTQPAASCAGSLGRQYRPVPQRSLCGILMRYIVFELYILLVYENEFVVFV
jgi:hypothetical protein